MARALAIVFLVLGFACRFLLTTQKFTAGVEGIAFLIVSLGFCVYSKVRTRNEQDGNEPHVIGILAAVMIIVYAVQLPRNYQFQTQLNRRVENLRLTAEKQGVLDKR
jgi:hypothetical protein